MTEKQKQLKIAFYKHYDSKLLRQEPYSGAYSYEHPGIVFLENKEPFEAELEYVTYEKGRSSLHTIWRDNKNKKEYIASMNLLSHAVKTDIIKEGKIKGTFQFYKQGTAILLEIL